MARSGPVVDERAIHLAHLELAHRQARALIDIQLEQMRKSASDLRAQQAWRAEAERNLATLRRDLAAANGLAQALMTSSSWRMTAPIRASKLAVRAFVRLLGKMPALRTAFSTIRPRAEGFGAYSLPAPLTRQSPPPLPVRLIAFYLPQFHPIAENSAWWGEGFTEWRNVRRGRPRYRGHVQPLIPGDLGYYDLLETPSIMARQVELARTYGVEAFCFYFYWFAGKTLLEEPIRRFADDGQADLPYCLCWANENWSRRWDGLDHEVLIAQAHSAEDDLAFIRHIAVHLKSPRYVRIDGRPLLIVYRPGLLPDPAATAARWREWCRRNGVGEIHLAYTQSFESVDPSYYGFDAAIEFPPNNTAPPAASDLAGMDPGFTGHVYDYNAFPKRAESYSSPPYPLYRGVFPSWDNEARRPGAGTSFAGATPEGYRRWLSLAAQETSARFSKPDQRLVFVNAWNEWAEGAILEPDARLGYANLQATRDALEIAAAGSRGRIVIVVHDAHRHGAQFLALNLARVFFSELHYGLDIVFLGDGPLVESFRRFGKVHVLDAAADGDIARSLAHKLREGGAVGGVCNTTVTGVFLKTLVEAGIPCVSLVHEMAKLLDAYGLAAHAEAITANARIIVFAAAEVRHSFEQYIGQKTLPALIRPQGAYKRNRNQTAAMQRVARRRIRKQFALPEDAKIVLGVGYGDERKGFDLFAVAARTLGAGLDRNPAFVWVGETPSALALAAMNVAPDNLILAGFQDDTDDLYSAADVYALTSREDPFPTVVLEAFDAGLPVVAFSGSSGFAPLISQGCGLLAPAFDAGAFAAQVGRLLSDKALAKQCGEVGRAHLAKDFDFRQYAFDIARLVDPHLLRVSVVVPNYNYARYMPGRLLSIAQQTDPAYELIVLDDASTDDSVQVIRAMASTLGVQSVLVENEINSGSVFAQWLRGVEAATGDIVWIAEADDLADPGFIAIASRAFADPSVVMSYVQSRQIDGDGLPMADDYFAYTDDVSATRWRSAYTADGVEEVRLGLSVKNTIPNASGVLFRRGPLLETLREQQEALTHLRVAGDWLVYISLLKKGRIAFDPSALNLHRRHSSGVTIGGQNAGQLAEIVEMQTRVQADFSVPASLRARAQAYARELYQQFGLSSADHQDIADDPRFSAYFAPDR